MKKLCLMALSFLICALLFGCASQKQSTFSAVDLNPKFQNGQYVQKQDSFLIINDISQSMSDPYKERSKLELGRDIIKRMNQTIPNLKMDAGLRVFGQVENFSLYNTKRVYGMTPYTKDGLKDALKRMGRSGGSSPLNLAIDGAIDDLTDVRGRMALIVVSDGEDMDNTPVQSAENIKARYGDRLCIYTIHVGINPSGKKLMERVAEAGRCGFKVAADDIYSGENMASYVESVFFGKPVVVKKEEPIVEQKREAQAEAAPQIITMDLKIEFDTGKTNIKPIYYEEIKKVADFMTENPQVTALIEGHTDSAGKRNKNIALSKARAASVKNYLISKFKINADRLKSAGYGPDKPIADNATLEGRQKNRRVQAVIDTNPKQDGGLADEKVVTKKTKKKVVKKTTRKKVKTR